jgi:GT2 family glycosyltransferase
LTKQPIEVAVIIVAYNSRDDLAECLVGINRWAGEGAAVHVVVVDCASEDGSAGLVRELFPEVGVIEAGENLGFAGGNNAGWEHVRKAYPGVKYVALLNPDTVPEPGWLDPLIDRLENRPDIATCQPLIMLHGKPGHINTAGNQSHYLGFGLVTQCGEPIPDGLTPQPIGYSSGAAMMVRADLLMEYGLFEPEMFLYCEDTDLGWKLSQLGYRHELIPGSRVAHKFDPKSAIRGQYYYLERNRWWLMLVYYKWPTLLLILPAVLLMEAGQVLFSLVLGKLGDKWRAWCFFLVPGNRRHIHRLRCSAQGRRTVCERDFVRGFTGRIDHPALGGPLLRYVANPLLDAYWWLVKRVLFW